MQQEIALKEKLPILSWLVGIFVSLAVLTEKIDVMRTPLKWFGAGMVLCYFLYFLSRRIRICPEILLYLAWAVWAMTGLFTATGSNEQQYWLGTQQTVLQIGFMMFVVAGITTQQKTFSFLQGTFITSVVIMAGLAIVTGDYAITEKGDETLRLAGLADNPNAFAIVIIFAMSGLAYFWMKHSRLKLIRYLVVGSLMTALIPALIMSGSRKGLFGLILLFFFWIWFCYRNILLRKPWITLFLIIVCCVGGLAIFQSASGNILGQRINQTIRALQGGSISRGLGFARSSQFATGLKLVANHPITGVGLDNSRLHTYFGLTIHSEWMRIPAETGIPGALLYFSCYAVLWIRLGRIRKYAMDPSDWKTAGLGRALLMTIFAFNFVAWFSTMKPAMILLAIWMGYSHSVWLKICQQHQYAIDMEQYGSEHEEAAPAWSGSS